MLGWARHVSIGVRLAAEKKVVSFFNLLESICVVVSATTFNIPLPNADGA